MSELLTLDMLAGVLPKALRNTVTPMMIDSINDVINRSDIKENYRENLVSYVGVMADGRFKMQQYIDAVRYVSHKLLGASNVKAYVMTFPDRYDRLIKLGKTKDTISNYVVAYNKNILVNKIMEQTLIPSHILNADFYQKAINTQAELMMTAVSEKVRTDAANSLLTHLKPPETKKIELDVNIKEDSAINDLRNSTLELVAQQRKMIEVGAMDVKEVAHSKLLIENGEVIDG